MNQAIICLQKRNLVDVKIIGLQTMTKLVSFRFDTQVDMKLPVRGCCNQHLKRDGVESHNKGNGANRIGRHQASVVKNAVLPSLFLIGNLLKDL
jgi:hypothetical protein